MSRSPPGTGSSETGGFAGKFWLIQSGHVALDVYVPGSGRVIVDTIGSGDLLRVLATRLQGTRTRLIAGPMSGPMSGGA